MLTGYEKIAFLLALCLSVYLSWRSFSVKKPICLLIAEHCFNEQNGNQFNS